MTDDNLKKYSSTRTQDGITLVESITEIVPLVSRNMTCSIAIKYNKKRYRDRYSSQHVKDDRWTKRILSRDIAFSRCMYRSNGSANPQQRAMVHYNTRFHHNC